MANSSRMSPVPSVSLSQWVTDFKHGVASKGSGLFVPLTDQDVATTFQFVTDALLAGKVELAQHYVEQLNREGMCYVLSEVIGIDPAETLLGLAEQTHP